MSLKDEQERLNTAEEYLLAYASSSQEFEAALEHLLWVNKNKPELQRRCAEILKNVVTRRSEEKHTMAKIGAIS